MMQTLLGIIMTEVQKVAQFALHTKISDGQLAGYINIIFVIYGVGDLSSTKLCHKFKDVHDETS